MSADPLDQASEQSQQMLDMQIKQRKTVLPHIGACHWCSSETDGIFCDNYCETDYYKHKEFNK